jgi:uncharacterized protein
LIELSREDCLRRLASQQVGRLAVAHPGDPPLVVPVNYILDGDIVVFRTGIGHKLLLLRSENVASFEVDDIDPFHRTGWSVLVQGSACERTSAEMTDLRLQPWAVGKRDRWFRLIPTRITGRAIILPEPYRDGRAYLM